MAEGHATCLEPIHVRGTSGTLFWTLFSPARDSITGTSCIILPPFAEEMNKSRRMMSLQARRLAEKGMTVLLPDFYGTGDSAGDFSGATMAIWLADIDLMLEHLSKRGLSTVSLLGVRMSSLICGAVSSRVAARMSMDRIVFWQPFTAGKSLVREFLRMRVAADMAADRRTSTGSLLQEAEATGAVEVAGYTLGNQLITELNDRSLAKDPPPVSVPVAWIEMTTTETRTLRVGSKKVVSEWRAQGRRLATLVEACPPFWSSTEIVESDQVLAATTRLLTEDPDHDWS